jgi:ABC-type dipeptide/oligopeptide/nickel transport system ATPase component
MVVLYLGRVAESGPTGELLARPAHPYTLALQAVAPGRHAACHRAGEVLSGLRPEGAPAQLAEDPGRL